jgi:gliding motility-associated-like protein
LFSSVSQGDIFWNGPANFSSNFWFNSIPASSVQSGIYAAWIEQNGCFSDTNEVLIKIENLINTSNLEIPNIITPNNDQINDSWHPNETLKNCFEFELIILNRWGEVVYTIDQFGDPFSGKDNTGKDLNDGIYFYSLSIDNQQINGFIHLIH